MIRACNIHVHAHTPRIDAGRDGASPPACPVVTVAREAIGTVCVLDDEPRKLDARQREGMQALARLTMTLLDTRLREQELERAVVLAEANARTGAAGFAVTIVQAQQVA
ncbi:MAG: hypothetical protein ABIR62_11575 [Dokdonella sp.]|uniref:hypothetical protein n=1 Tax=Dokdonella sp. TaxID=2291710 RepID=UPI003263C129